jgi:hypothetical protein
MYIDMEKKNDEEEDGHSILDRLAAKARPARIREVSKTVVVLPMVLVQMIADYCTITGRYVFPSIPVFTGLHPYLRSYCEMFPGIEVFWSRRSRQPINETHGRFPNSQLCPVCGDGFWNRNATQWCLNHNLPPPQRLTILDFDPGLGRY